MGNSGDLICFWDGSGMVDRAPFLALKGSPESRAPERMALSRHPRLPTGERSVLRQ